MTPAEQSKTSKCRCHSGEPCSCAGPVQIYQYIPPEASSSTSTASTNSEGLKTPSNGAASMLHTFQTTPGSVNLNSATQIRNQNADPYPSAQFLHGKGMDRAYGFRNSELDDLAYGSNRHQIPGPKTFTAPLNMSPLPYTPPTFHERVPSASSMMANLPRQHQQADSSSISRSTRSIGINTDPLPSGIWPDNLFEVPNFMPQNIESVKSTPTEQSSTTKASSCCPKLKDMPLTDIGLSQYALTDATAPVPTYSTFYAPNDQPVSGDNTATAAPTSPSNLMSIDHYEEDFDPEYFESIFDVPGCSLPGVQCRCGEDCSCAGCQTHKNNMDKVAFKDFERMDFSSEEKVRDHPAACCDTRFAHVHPDNKQSTTTDSSGGGGCCGGRRGAEKGTRKA